MISAKKFIVRRIVCATNPTDIIIWKSARLLPSFKICSLLLLIFSKLQFDQLKYIYSTSDSLLTKLSHTLISDQTRSNFTSTSTQFSRTLWTTQFGRLSTLALTAMTCLVKSDMFTHLFLFIFVCEKFNILIRSGVLSTVWSCAHLKADWRPL